MKSFIAALLIAPVFAFAAASAKPADRPATVPAALLFGYVPKPGQRQQFTDGYRRHLQWHRQHADPLVWYGWFVTSGDRLGMFIDGTFGKPFAAIDKRVDPSGDAADAAKNFAPFGVPVFRSGYVLRRDLSTGWPLEERHPSETVQVYYYTLQPGAAAQFESAVRAARQALLKMPNAPAHTWYELAEGGAHPGYMLMVARDRWTSYDGFRRSLDQLAGPEGAARLRAAVKRIKSEVWEYAPALSYYPTK